MEALHRIFIGGLFESVTKDELKARFESFGDVSDVTIVQKKDEGDSVYKTFGYVNLKTTTQKLNRCFAVYGGTKWKGHQLKVQLANEDFMTKLKREWDEPSGVVKTKKKKLSSGPTKTYTDIMKTASTMKNVVPGTPVDGERNWVIGKYGRPLPIVHIPNVGGKKLLKVDPSKFCHCLKKVADDTGDNVGITTLTWAYNEDDNVIKAKKKRKEKENRNEDGECCMTNINNDSTTLTESTVCSDGSTVSSDRKKKKKKKTTESIPDLLVDAVQDLVKDNGCAVKQRKRKNMDDEVDINRSEGLEGSLPRSDMLELPGLSCSTNEQKQEDTGESDVKSNCLISSDSSNHISVSDDVLPTERKRRHKHKKIEGEKDQNVTQIQTKEATQHNDSFNAKSKTFEVGNCTYEQGELDKPPGKRLSTSIIEQLLSNRKLPPDLSENHEHVSNKDAIEQSCLNANNEERDSGKIENMFDFEFETITGRNESFLSTLMNNIEMREDINETDEDSDVESESNSDSSEPDSECLNSKPLLDVDNETEVPEFTQKDLKENEVVIEQEASTCESLNEPNNFEPNTAIKTKKMKKVEGDINSQVKKIKISSSNKQEKHALSEERRRKSLDARNMQISQSNNAVSKALKEVDKPCTSVNRIVFPDTDEDEDKDKDQAVTPEKPGNLKGLWSDDEDDEDGNFSKNVKQLFDDVGDAEDEDIIGDEISLKPQFHGKGGEKLFKMQQRYGGDERFKLDERFTEDGDQDNVVDDTVESDSTERDLQQEKERNISVLEQVLGKPLALEKGCDHGQAYQRYDPENVEHEKYEVKVDSLKGSAEDETETTKSKTKPIPQKLPEVSKDTFYSVDESIKDLFVNKGESTSFSFFGNQDEGESTVENDKHESVEMINDERLAVVEDTEIEADDRLIEAKVKGKKLNRGLEEAHEAEEALNVEQTVASEKSMGSDEKLMCTYLWFPEDDKRLETGKRFIRTEDIHEITNQWKAVRRNLTEDYKKKHKDAVRRVRKMREKRFSLR